MLHFVVLKMPILTGVEMRDIEGCYAEHDDHKWYNSINEDAVLEETI